MNDIFKEEYINYWNNLTSITVSIDFRRNANEYFKQLHYLSIPIYDNINNKEEWLKKEILSISDNNVQILEEYDLDFNVFYNQSSLLKIDLIDEYLKIRELTGFELNLELEDVLNKFTAENKYYIIARQLSILINYSKYDKSSFNLLDKLFSNYYLDEEFEDKTILLELATYVEQKFKDEEIIILKKKYNKNSIWSP